MDARMQKHRMARWLVKFVAALPLVLFATPSPAQAAVESVAPLSGGTFWRTNWKGGSFPSAVAACSSLSPGDCPVCGALTYVGVQPNRAYPSYMDCVFFYKPGDGTPGWNTLSGTAIPYSNAVCPIPTVNPTVPYQYKASSGMCERESQCIAPNAIYPATGKCEPPETYTITLDQESATLEPSGTSAQNVKTAQVFTATVTSNKNAPKAGATVAIRAEIEAHSGGHPHDDANRPKGILGNSTVHTLCNPNATQPQACITGITDTNGQFIFTFNSTEVAGKHTVTATCDVCNGNQDEANITVKVEGLVSLSANSTDYVLVGGTTTHNDNHYLTSPAKTIMEALAKQYHRKFPNDPLLHLNDASLKEGGVLDICTGRETSAGCASASYKHYVPMCELQPNGTYACSWARPHIEHRRGSVIDVRANNDATSIPRRNEEEFLRLARQLRVDTGEYPHSPDSSNRHWHIRLLGVAE